MKTSVIAICVILSLFSLSCKKTTEYSVRINNQTANTIGTLNFVHGTSLVVTFSNIASKQTTDYKEIPEGTYDIAGDLSASGLTFNAGSGKHRWTLTIESDGSTLDFKED